MADRGLILREVGDNVARALRHLLLDEQIQHMQARGIGDHLEPFGLDRRPSLSHLAADTTSPVGQRAALSPQDIVMHCRYGSGVYCISETAEDESMDEHGPLLRDLELGAIRVHIRHHAAHEPIYGVWMVEELARHGYTLSYGTLYSTLHRMEQEGLLAREDRLVRGRVRKYYTATEQGRRELARARRLVAELYQEVAAGKDQAPVREGGG